MKDIEIDLSSGQVIECFDIEDSVVHGLEDAFFHRRLEEVFKVIDKDGYALVMIKDITAICVANSNSSVNTISGFIKDGENNS